MSDPYEEFSEQQEKILNRFVTNTKSNVFALRNLPEVIKGALFSRYSRSTLGLRSLLLKEFIGNNEETSFEEIVGGKRSEDFEGETTSQNQAIKKAQNFYDRILDGYGDDSIGELGGAHLAIEQVSMLAAKVIEDARIGGSPLEKSTRYVYFDQKINGEYLFYREPVLMTSAYRDLYVDTCNMLFDTYSNLIPRMSDHIEQNFPLEEEGSKAAYKAALRAKVLDCLRGLLPAGTLTNMGVYGNGRFFDALIHKLRCHRLAELQDIGKQSFEELAVIIPSFIRRAEASHRHHQSFSQYFESSFQALQKVTQKYVSPVLKQVKSFEGPSVRLLDYNLDAPRKVAAALLFPFCELGLEDLNEQTKNFTSDDMIRIFEGAASSRENRRHKSPRALEHASFTFEILADFGVYRDLQRHRTLTQDRQLLGCDYGYYIPPEILGTDMEGEYRKALEDAKISFDKIRAELPEEAQYSVPMAYNIRWYFHINLRALQWLAELRSSPQGHPGYRYIAQEMVKQVIKVFPQYESFFKFVDFEGYDLGRLGQETRNAERKEAQSSTQA